MVLNHLFWTSLSKPTFCYQDLENRTTLQRLRAKNHIFVQNRFNTRAFAVFIRYFISTLIFSHRIIDLFFYLHSTLHCKRLNMRIINIWQFSHPCGLKRHCCVRCLISCCQKIFKKHITIMKFIEDVSMDEFCSFMKQSGYSLFTNYAQIWTKGHLTIISNADGYSWRLFSQKVAQPGNE